MKIGEKALRFHFMQHKHQMPLNKLTYTLMKIAMFVKWNENDERKKKSRMKIEFYHQ